MLFAAGTFCAGTSSPSLAQSPTESLAPLLRIAPWPSDPVPTESTPSPHDEDSSPSDSRPPEAAVELKLQAPINSTIEIRVARRPWLLEKLINPRAEPSIKMNPPRPPAELSDPPSISRMSPADLPNDGWVSRQRGVPSYADVPLHVVPGEKNQRKTSKSDQSSQVENGLRAESSTPESDANTRDIDPPAKTGQIDPGYSPTDAAYTDSEDARSADTEPPAAESSAEADSSDVASESSVAAPENAESDLSGEPTDESDSIEPTEDRSEPAETHDAERHDGPSAAHDSNPPGRVKVRRLQIGRYGEPIGKGKSASPGRRSEGVSAYVESDPVSPDAIAVDLDYAGYPREPIRLTRSVYRMQNSIRQCLRYYYGRPESANERSNWGMLHSIMVYGIDTRVIVGNRSYCAIAWIAGNNACRGQRLLSERNGMITANSGVGLQGHQAQMLAIFSLCDVPAKYPMYAGEHRYSLNDIIDAEMLACKSGEELTFTLIGLAHYLDTNLIWRNADGQIWGFERLIREELAQSIVGAACGGTHRLMGFAHALRKRRAEGRPITGQWKRAELFTRDFVDYAYRLQNRDGSMSTDWFEGREDNGNLDRKIQTTGHIVEWLLTVTPDSQLQNPRLVNAIRFLLTSLYEERDHDWKIGPKGHALRSLAMYYERVYQDGPAWQPRAVADSQRASLR